MQHMWRQIQKLKMQQTSQLQFGFCVSLNICVYTLVNVLVSYNTVLFIFKAKVK